MISAPRPRGISVRPLVAAAVLVAVAFATSACGAEPLDERPAAPATSVSTVGVSAVQVSTTEAVDGEPTTIDESPTTAPTTVHEPTDASAAASPAEPSGTLAMTADDISELEAELDAIDALLTEIDVSFEED